MRNVCKYLFVVMVCAMSVAAYPQSDNSGAKLRMRTSIFLNAGISDCRRPAIGLTIAGAAQFGYYASFLIGVDNMHAKYDYRIDPDGRLLDGEHAGLIPFYSGRRAYNRISVSAGAMCRMGIPLYAYLGAGYGFKCETRELLNRQWGVVSATDLNNSAVIEAGLVGHIKNFSLLAGYNLFVGQQNRLFHEAKVGIGYTFD